MNFKDRTNKGLQRNAILIADFFKTKFSASDTFTPHPPAGYHLCFVEKFAQNCSKGDIVILNKEPPGDRHCMGALGSCYATPPSRGLVKTAVTISKDLLYSTGNSS